MQEKKHNNAGGTSMDAVQFAGYFMIGLVAYSIMSIGLTALGIVSVVGLSGYGILQWVIA